MRPNYHSFRPGLTLAALVAASVVGVGCTSVPPPARYVQTACAHYVHLKKDFKADINWCAQYVQRHADALEVNVSWALVRVRGEADTVYQITDELNHRMYLTDESGRRYDHTRVSGAALGSMHTPGSVRHGSFFFPLPAPGARTFQFHDDENGVRLELRL